jgi:hypothetical protein
MSRHEDMASVGAAIAGGGHRVSRVMRFIKRHAGVHQAIRGELRRRQRRRDRLARKKFEAMQGMPADTKVKIQDPLPWTRKGRRMAFLAARSKAQAQTAKRLREQVAADSGILYLEGDR